MDIQRMLAELRAEREEIEQAILSLERLQARRGRRHLMADLTIPPGGSAGSGGATPAALMSDPGPFRNSRARNRRVRTGVAAAAS
jgi:hypothetical protein